PSLFPYTTLFRSAHAGTGRGQLGELVLRAVVVEVRDQRPRRRLELEQAEVRLVRQAEPQLDARLRGGELLGAVSGLALLEGQTGLRVGLALLLLGERDGLAVGDVHDAVTAVEDHGLAQRLLVLDDDVHRRCLGEDLEVVLAGRVPLLDALRGAEQLDDAVGDGRVAGRHAPLLERDGLAAGDVARAEAPD